MRGKEEEKGGEGGEEGTKEKESYGSRAPPVVRLGELGRSCSMDRLVPSAKRLERLSNRYTALY